MNSDDGQDYTLSPAVLRLSAIGEHIDKAKACKVKFGVEFLDQALIGILPNDLVIIGGRPGYGKSQLGATIAAHNVVMRRRVLFIALEAEPEEIEMRLKYQIVSGLFFQDKERPRHVDLSYRSWRFGAYKDELAAYDAKADRIFSDKFATLDTVYRRSKFTVSTLKTILSERAKDYDLVVIDHLHYFDLEGSGNEHSQLAAIVKQVRDLNLFHDVPIVLLAHLRKDCYGVAPELADFMGSSEIGKQATICIMISKDPGNQDFKNHVYGTVMTVPKARTGSVAIAGLTSFSGIANAYMLGYKLAKVFRHGDKESIEEISGGDYPKWAQPTRMMRQQSEDSDNFEA